MITKLVEGKNGVKLPVVHKEKLTLEEAFGEKNSNANSRTMRKVNEDKSQLVSKAKKEKIMPAQRNHVSLKGQKEIQGKGIYAHNEHPEKKVKEIDEDFDYKDNVSESIDEPKPGKTITIDQAVKVIESHIDMGSIGDIYSDDDFIGVSVYWGDWKHDHRALDNAIQNLFYNASIDEMVTEEDGSDCYSADHIIEFEGGQPQLNDGVKFEGGND